MRIYNRNDAEGRRRHLRQDAPPVERILWQKLRGSQIAEAKFRRQYSVGAFVLDFYCPELRLAIELDGESHDGEVAAKKDAFRQREIENLGIVFLRFTNQQIHEQLMSVLENIEVAVLQIRSESQPA